MKDKTRTGKTAKEQYIKKRLKGKESCWRTSEKTKRCSSVQGRCPEAEFYASRFRKSPHVPGPDAAYIAICRELVD